MSDTASAADGPAPERRRFLYLLPAAIFLALAMLLLVRLFSGDPSRIPSALIGRTVPAFTLPALADFAPEGKPLPGLSSADLAPGAGGRVTIVNVFASWCGPCRVEHPSLVTIAKDPAVRVVGINYKDDPENARRFLGALGNPYAAIGADPSGRAAIEWGVYGVPETFIVDPKGVIRAKHVGPILPEHVPGLMQKVRDAQAP